MEAPCYRYKNTEVLFDLSQMTPITDKSNNFLIWRFHFNKYESNSTAGNISFGTEM